MPRFTINVLRSVRVYEETWLDVDAPDQAAAEQLALTKAAADATLEWSIFDSSQPEDFEVFQAKLGDANGGYPPSAQAVAEGWGIFWSDARGWEIQRVDHCGTFDSDEDAVAHVKARATAGSEYHQACLRFLGG